MKARLDIEEYMDRVCIEKCEDHKKLAKVRVENGRDSQKWSWLFESKCVNCPLEIMRQCLREERDGYMELELEVA